MKHTTIPIRNTISAAGIDDKPSVCYEHDVDVDIEIMRRLSLNQDRVDPDILLVKS